MDPAKQPLRSALIPALRPKRGFERRTTQDNSRQQDMASQAEATDAGEEQDAELGEDVTFLGAETGLVPGNGMQHPESGTVVRSSPRWGLGERLKDRSPSPLLPHLSTTERKGKCQRMLKAEERRVN